MNSFSWFLYFAGIAKGVYILFFIVGSMGALVSSLIGGMLVIEYGKEKKPFVIAFIVSCFLLIVSALIPSKDTLYAIAASEIGEQAYKSELGQKASKAIEMWIDSQLSKK